MPKYRTIRKIVEAENRTNREIARSESYLLAAASKDACPFLPPHSGDCNLACFALSSGCRACNRRYGYRLRADSKSQVNHVGASVSSCPNSQHPKGASHFLTSRCNRKLCGAPSVLSGRCRACARRHEVDLRGLPDSNTLATTGAQKGPHRELPMRPFGLLASVSSQRAHDAFALTPSQPSRRTPCTPVWPRCCRAQRWSASWRCHPGSGTASTPRRDWSFPTREPGSR